MGVATPASYVAGGGPHTTIEEDEIIDLVPFSMYPNVDNYAPDEEYSYFGHYFKEIYLEPGRPSEEKIITDVIEAINDLGNLNDNSSCGWPAIYASGVSLYRKVWNTDNWDTLWSAALNGDLVIEFRVDDTGIWQSLNRRKANISPTGEWVQYHLGAATPDAYQYAPFVFIQNYNSYYSYRDHIVEVQPFDVDNSIPAGLQDYRFIINDQVVGQFSIDYDQEPWVSAKTTAPISDTLLPGSNPIELIH